MEDIDFSPIESGGLSGSSEAPREQSEKQKESSRKAQAQIQKTQKDEKKAKADNDDLFLLLKKFIQNPLYDELIPSISILLEKGIPSRFILVLIALVYPEATHYISSKLGLHNDVQKMLHIHRYEEITVFHETNIHPSLRDWISFWMMISKRFLTEVDASVVLDVKLIDILSTQDRQKVRQVFGIFFHFFFYQKNVEMPYEKANTYAGFIVSEFEKEIQKHLEGADVDLKTTLHVDVSTLFGS